MMLRDSGHRKPRPLPASLRPGGGLEPCRTAKDPTPPATHPPRLGCLFFHLHHHPTHPVKHHAGPGTYTPALAPAGGNIHQALHKEGALLNPKEQKTKKGVLGPCLCIPGLSSQHTGERASCHLICRQLHPQNNAKPLLSHLPWHLTAP